MYLNQKKLNDYEKVIVIDNSIRINDILLKLKLINKKTLLIVIWDKKLLNLLFEKNLNKNIDIELFSWNLFQDKYHLRWQSHEIAYNNLEKDFTNLTKQNETIYNFMENLYKTSDVCYALKKNLLIETQQKIEKEKIIENLKILIPNIEVIINKKSFNRFLSYEIINHIYLSVKNIFIFFFYGIYAILKMNLKRRKKNFNKIAIRLYGDGYKISTSHNSLDWINDNIKIKNSDINIIIENLINKNDILEIKKKNYKYFFCIKKRPIQFLDVSLIIFILFKIYPRILYNALNFITAPLTIKKTINSAIINKIIWTNFINFNEPKIFISYHNYQSDHIFRNIILKKINCKSITFKHTQGENIYDTRGKYNNVIQGYNFHHQEYLWGKSSLEMSKKDHNKSINLRIIPPIWSSKEIRNFSRDNLGINIQEENCISVFTSGLNLEPKKNIIQQKNIHNVNSIYDHVNFLKFFIKFLKIYTDKTILFKPKYKIKYAITNPLMRNAIDELVSSGRFFLYDDISRASTVYENSKIVISMPFTSVVIEALCAGKKSFFLDINGRFKYSYYRKFPDLIANSEEESFRLFKKWNNMKKSDLKIYKNILEEEFDTNRIEDATVLVREEIIKQIKFF